MKPYGIHDPVRGLIHIGLYESPDDCWQIFLGWPAPEEIAAAKARGLTCLLLTCTYDPRRPQ